MHKPKKKILVIDDEAVFRDAISYALNHCGYTCVSESNPSDGIMRLKKEDFDLILLDIMMEPLDGWDTLALINPVSGNKRTPVMMASAKKLDINEIIRYGELVSGFIIKPFVDCELCEEITDFFTWYGALLLNSHAARLQGVPQDICNLYVDLVRQRKAILQMLDLVSPYCKPDENHSEADCMADRMKEVQKIIAEKMKKRDELLILHPVFIKA